MPDVRRLDIASAKLTVVFPEGKLPAIDPADPAFVLVLGGLEIRGKINAKAARKLAQHKGGAVLYTNPLMLSVLSEAFRRKTGQFAASKPERISGLVYYRAS